MNIMRKWWGAGGGREGNNPGSENSEQQKQHLALGLMHLKKLFSELLYPSHPLSEDEREDKLYNMLPLFCKVFGASPATDLIEKFADVLPFTQHVSKLMVTEIRRRASNQSTAAASCAIARFLECDAEAVADNDDGVNSGGWLLLNALNLLADGPPQIIEVMTASSLPSTLVKCLYLFFDLPEGNSVDTEETKDTATNDNNDSTDNGESNKNTEAPVEPKVETLTQPEDVDKITESRVMLQKVFVQLLLRLVSHVGPGEELARKDDLSLLFSASTSWCPSHNALWRKSASEVLMTLSRHALSQNIINYIHNKGCIALCVENMERTNDLSPLEIVEMLVAIFSFLKDSADFSQTLLDDFKSAQGYAFLVDFLLRLEKESMSASSAAVSPTGSSASTSTTGSSSTSGSVTSEAHEALRNLVLLIASLTYCGHSQPMPTLHPSTAIYTLPGFVLPTPATRGSSVRNVAAFNVLQLLFQRAKSGTLCSVVLDAISSVYHSDDANYFILEQQATLSSFGEKIHSRPATVQGKYFELVELLVFELNHVPCKELVALSLIVKLHHVNHPMCVIAAIDTLMAILKHHALFKDVYREVGLLEVFVRALANYPQILEAMSVQEASSLLEPSHSLSSAEKLCVLSMEILTSLLTASADNASVFRQAAGGQLLLSLLHFKRSRVMSMALMQQLIVVGGNEEDMSALLDVLNTPLSVPKTEEGTDPLSNSLDPLNSVQYQLTLKTDVLKTLVNCLKESHRSRSVFRKVGGFVRVLSLVVSLRNSLSDSPESPFDSLDAESLLTLLMGVFATITTAMRYEPANAKFFHSEICNGTLLESLRQLGCFHTSVSTVESISAPHWSLLLSTNSSSANKNASPLHHLSKAPPKKLGASPGLEVDDHSIVNEFHNAFATPIMEYSAPSWLPMSMVRCLQVIQMLYHTALDSYDKPTSPLPALAPTSAGEGRTSALEVDTSSTSNSSVSSPHSTPGQVPPCKGSPKPMLGGLNLSTTAPSSSEVLIIHGGVVVTLLHLMPSLIHHKHLRLSALLQLYTAHLIKSLVRSERNQQVMCEVGMVKVLIEWGSTALMEENHPLHSQFHYIYERLSAHSSTPTQLRAFLRLGDPLNCRNIESFNCNDEATHNPAVALDRVQTLVTMASVKHNRNAVVHSSSVLQSQTVAPFVEFDMSAEGFGCMFLPSIAPQTPGGSSSGGVVGNAVAGGIHTMGIDHAVIGGIGAGDRSFPPPGGLSYSTWFTVEKFSEARVDPHSVRLLSLVRQIPGKTSPLLCLTVSLSARDKALLVSTQEIPLPHQGQVVQDTEPSPSGDTACRIWCPDLITEGHWHHLVVTLNKAVLKTSTLCIYVDGKLVKSQKLQYISQYPGGGAVNLNIPPSVYGYIGSAPCYRRVSRLVWRQGVCHLMEDVLTATSVSLLYQLGPTYRGSLQAPQLPGSDPLPPIVLEDKLVLGLNAAALSHFTLNKIRKFYSKVDSKAIAKQLGMSSHENATPIRVVHNSAGHLNGSARCMGGVIIGYLGVRVFTPKPVGSVLQTLGGISVMLGLVAMSSHQESLYAAVKALTCVIKTNKEAQMTMIRKNGYQTLALLLQKKLHLLNCRTLDMCFTLVMSGEPLSPLNKVQGVNVVSPAIPNVHVFTDLILNMELWCSAPGSLWRPLLEYMLELAKESPDRHNNLIIMRSFGLLPRFLHLLYDYLGTKDSPLPSSNSPSPPHTSPGFTTNPNPFFHYSQGPATSPLLYSLITVLLAVNPRHEDLLSYGQFILWSLPPSHVSERTVEFDVDKDGNIDSLQLLNSVMGSSDCRSGSATPMTPSGRCLVASPRTILLRNKCLEILHTLMYNSNKNTIHLGFCEEVVRVLGLDFVVLLTSPHLHSSTVLLSLRMLVALLSNANILVKFREASSNGGWLTNLHHVTSNKQGLVLGYSVGNRALSSLEIKDEVCFVPGFQTLTDNMSAHIEIMQSYFLMLALMLGQPVKTLPNSNAFELSSVWNYLFGCSPNSTSGSLSGRVTLCAEAILTTLNMMRYIITPENKSPTWLLRYPSTILDFLFFLHEHNDDFLSVLLSSEVVASLSLSIFPVFDSSAVNSARSDSFKRFSSVSDMEVILVSEVKCLSNHPVKEKVIKLLEQLVLDSLVLPPPNKPPHTIDYILDAPPESSSVEQVSEFHTLLLSALMERIRESVSNASSYASHGSFLEGVWIRPRGYIPSGGSSQHVPPNLFYLIARMVDKMWSGLFEQDPHPLLDLIVSLIGCAKKSVSTVQCLDLIYSCLNRTILFLLSRPLNSVTGHRAILEGLHKLTTHRVIVFGAGNHDLEFVACLTHCLLQLTAQLQIRCETVKTVWHVNSGAGGKTPDTSVESNPLNEPVDPKLASKQRDEAMARATQSHHLMVNAATRVWEELYITKKPAIEEVFKVSLTSPHTGKKAPELENVRVQVTESPHKLWQSFLECEKKQTYATRMMPWEMPTHFQTVTNVSKKLQKVTGGLTRLASRTKSRREDSIVSRKTTIVNYSNSEVAKITSSHLSLARELVNLQHNRWLQKHEDNSRYCWSLWEKEERELTRERGLWGPLGASHLDKWMLDVTEGPCRMRKKLVFNPHFYHHYPPHKPLSELEQSRHSKYKMACSFHSEEYHRKWRPSALANREMKHHLNDIGENTNISGETNPEVASFVGKDVTDMDVSGIKGTMKKITMEESSGDDMIAGGDKTEEDGDPSELIDSGISGTDLSGMPTEEVQTPDNQSLLRLLEQDDKVSHMFRCARIQGLDTVEALLLFGREHFYIVDGFTLLKSREIRDIESLPPGTHDPVIPSAQATTTYTSPTAAAASKLMTTEETHACSKIHYDEIREALQRRYLLQPIAIEIFSSDGRNHLLAFPKAKERNKVYQRMLIVCTGLADSAHQSIEGQKRSASVEQTGGLFSSLIGETSVTHRWVRGEISNFQYLMHLNTLAGRSYNDLMQYPIFPWVLADYESHTLDFKSPSTFRDLSKPMGAQTPDRLEQFRKRYREWDDPSGETPPYHYGTHYSSAMIVSSYLVRMEPFTQHFLKLQGGHFDLADRMFHSLKEAWLSASKNNMADIKELIPEFFYLPDFLCNSNAFDLGIKQSGVQLDDIILPPWAKGDPHEFIRVHRAALECDYVSANLHHWIDLIFGYKQQGQQSVEAVNVFHHLFYEGNVDIYSIDDPLKQKATIGFINNFGQIPKQLFRKPHPCKKLGGQRASIMEASPLTQAPAVTPLEKVFYKRLDSLKPALQPIKEVKGVVGEIISTDKGILAVEQNKVLIPSTYQRYLACGFADHSLRIGPYESDKALLVYEGDCEQTGEVLAAVCPNARTVVTAATDTVVRVYEINRRQLVHKSSLYGHSDAVTCIAASTPYGLLVSGSRDKTAIIWDLARMSYVRQLSGHHAPLAAVAINDSTGDIGTCAGTWLYLWTINGVPIASVNTALGARSSLQQVLCLTFSTAFEWDCDNVVITGSSDGVIRMWGTEYVQVPIDEDTDNSTSGMEGTRDVEGVSESTQPPLSEKQEKEGGFLRKAASESSLSEEENDESLEDCTLDEEVKEEASVKQTTDEESPKTTNDVLKPIDDGEPHVFAGVSTSPSRQEGLKLQRQEALMSAGSHPSLETTMSLDVTAVSSVTSSTAQITAESSSLTSSSVTRIESASVSDVTKLNPNEMLSPSKLHASKSVDNFSGSMDNFEVISESDIREAQSEEILNSPPCKNEILLPGMKWARQLVFRCKLTTHTAYDNANNMEPASVTAVTVAKDHRSVLVGDARGRVFSWTVPDGGVGRSNRARGLAAGVSSALSVSNGGPADHWVKDETTSACTSCHLRFTVYERKHHCRNCGQVFCSKCSRFESEIFRLKIFRPVRVCQKCFVALKSDRNAAA